MNFQAEKFFPYERLLVKLVQDGVDFAAVGGIAISLNNYIRATDDADILVNDSPENKIRGATKTIWMFWRSKKSCPAKAGPRIRSFKHNRRQCVALMGG